MRLLNVETLRLESFNDDELPSYAIISHTWGKDEVTFGDLDTPRTYMMTTHARLAGT
jgi:hypothetical protein